jgi:CubicO group peptidase (beta-lactamase class C family)
MMLLPFLVLQSLDPAVVDRLAKASLEAWKAPGAAIAIVGPDKIVYMKGYGVKKVGAPDAVTTKTVFAIGSTTKAFTSAAAAMLVDEGLLQWDDPVRKHLPEFRLSDAAANELVTVRDLLSHRTGLARNDGLWFGSPWQREEILDRVSRVPLTKPFRSAWQYQNIMFLAAGQLVTRVAGTRDWEELVQRRILGPLGMRDTSFTPDDAIRNADHAWPHAKRKGQLEIVPWRNLDNIGPAGSINSNVEDLAKWVRVHLNEGKPLLKPASFEEMRTPQMAMRREDWGRNFTDESNQMTYGLGWFLSDYRGEHVVHHGGAIDGFRAQITILPKQQLGIIVLANLGSENMPEALRWKLVDHLLKVPQEKDWDAFLIKREPKDPPKLRRIPDTKPSLALTSYAGDYQDAAYGIARVTATAKGLELAWAGDRVPLEHFHHDTFEMKHPRLEGYVPFALNAAGAVSRLTFQGVEFRRMPAALSGEKTAALFLKALRLGKEEKVIVRYDPDYLHELTGPIEAAIRKAGGVVSASLPYAEKGKDLAGCSDFVKRLEESTVYLWMPLDESKREVTGCETRALTKWLDAGGAHREIHFHWSGGSVLADGLVTEHQPEFDHVYAKALDVDYARMSQEQDRFVSALRGGKLVRVHTSGGTDLTFRIGDRPFNKQDGDASAERMKSARVRVDREIELPAGVLRVAPLEDTANGVIAVAKARFGSTMVRDLRLTIREGRVTEVTAAAGREAVEQALQEGGDSARRFREFGLGFNPLLVAPKGSPILPYFAYGKGMVRLSLGDNEELGGSVRGMFRRWFFFPDATVEVDGRVLARAE